jgi:hypothetical protein
VKKYLVFLAFLFVATAVRAETDPWAELKKQGMSVSSRTAAYSTQVIVATAPSAIFNVTVASPGVNSFIDIYDSEVSTADANRLLGSFQTTTAITHRLGGQYGHYMSSGIAVFNRYSGATGQPADVSIYYEWK